MKKITLAIVMLIAFVLYGLIANHGPAFAGMMNEDPGGGEPNLPRSIRCTVLASETENIPDCCPFDAECFSTDNFVTFRLACNDRGGRLRLDNESCGGLVHTFFRLCPDSLNCTFLPED
jgi:hypothetical protein